ncbi:MAG: hypothetical protein JNK33_05765 [Candidatus Doudnabacteria bacterium]|nr:hypothetical protein [Candidatus Doudnabacteria bacterium]
MELTEERLIEILDHKLDEKFKEFPTKVEFKALQFAVEDIQEKVDRIDKRTDEDVRAVMKDVELLKLKHT